MTDALIGLPCVCLVAFVLGAGWGATFRHVTPWGIYGFLFRSWTAAIALTSLVWAWAYPLGISVRWALLLELAVAGAGYVVALSRGDRIWPFRSVGARTWMPLVGILAMSVLALVPAMASLTRLTVGIRIGPDEFGYAISARAIEEGLTHSQIVHEIFSETGGHSIEQVISPVTRGIDTTPSFTTQVRGEFLEGADRWGFAGATGSVLFVIGADHLWALLSLLAAFGLVVTCTGIWAATVGRGRRARDGLVAVVLLGFSCCLLNAWHEGGLGQMWMMPAGLLIALAILSAGDRAFWGAAASVGIGVVAILPSYNQDAISFGIFVAVAFVLMILVTGHDALKGILSILAGTAGAALLVFPAFFDFASTLGTSLQENSTAGWAQNYWLSPAQAFGLSDPFTTTLTSALPRTLSERALDGAGLVLLTVFIVTLCYRRLRSIGFVLLSAPVIVCLISYIDTRYLHSDTSYEYFKLVATLAPVAAVGAGLLLSEPRRPGAPARERWSRVVQPVLAAGMCAAVLASAATYFYDYRSEGATVPTSLESIAGSARAQAVLTRYNVVGEDLGPPVYPFFTLYDAYTVATEGNLRFIGRTTGFPPTRLTGRLDNPVGMLVFEGQCPQFGCIAHVPRSAIAFKGDGVALIELSPSTRQLATLPQDEWGTWTASKFRGLGGSLSGLRTQGQPV